MNTVRIHRKKKLITLENFIIKIFPKTKFQIYFYRNFKILQKKKRRSLIYI